MNIFALQQNPKDAVIEMIDKHIVKMPTESCQMLHTNALYFQYINKYNVEPTLRDLKEFYYESDSILMKPAMLNHPSTIWARETPQNFIWLYTHATAMCEEYTYRYGKVHGSQKRIEDTPMEMIHEMESKFPSTLTPVSIAMFDRYRIDRDDYFKNNPQNSEWDFVIDSYRNYYLEAKWSFASWKKRSLPSWWGENHIREQTQIRLNLMRKLRGDTK